MSLYKSKAYDKIPKYFATNLQKQFQFGISSEFNH